MWGKDSYEHRRQFKAFGYTRIIALLLLCIASAKAKHDEKLAPNRLLRRWLMPAGVRHRPVDGTKSEKPNLVPDSIVREESWPETLLPPHLLVSVN
jgi:hypothetical protein